VPHQVFALAARRRFEHHPVWRLTMLVPQPFERAYTGSGAGFFWLTRNGCQVFTIELRRTERRPQPRARTFPDPHVPDGAAVLSNLPLKVR
jgi:hypothetical protein